MRRCILVLCLALIAMGSCNGQRGARVDERRLAGGDRVVLRFESGQYAVPDVYERVEFGGDNYRFLKQIVLSACDIDRVVLAEEIPGAYWSVELKLAESAGAIPRKNQNRRLGLFIEGQIRGVAQWYHTGDSGLEIPEPNEEAARQLGQALTRSLTAARRGCGKAGNQPKLERIKRQIPHDRRPAFALSTPSPKCTKEAKRARLHGKMLLEIVVREDGLLDAEKWKVLEGKDEDFARQVIEQMVSQWRFRPASYLGKRNPWILNYQYEYHCRAVNGSEPSQ